MKPISKDKVNDISSLLSNGLSVRAISQRLQVSKSKVGRIRKSMKVSPTPAKRGRPAKLTPSDKRFCIHQITTGKIQSATAVARNLMAEFNIVASANTVRRTLREAGLGAIEKIRKPMLSQSSIKKRLEFAKRHQHWTVSDWHRVIWSDESKVNRFNSDGRQWAWIRDNAELTERHIKPTVKHGGGSVMVWACITPKGPGFLCKIDGNMDQTLYKEIIDGELQQTIDWYQLDEARTIFQHDNDPKHTAKSIKTLLAGKQYSLLTWPPQSPDMNPIEHIWSLVKRRLNDFTTPPSGITELWERVQHIWNQVTPEDCLKVIESMPRRIEALLKARGKWTEY